LIALGFSRIIPQTCTNRTSSIPLLWKVAYVPCFFVGKVETNVCAIFYFDVKLCLGVFLSEHLIWI
jgi:hypothetical protein